MRIVTSSATQPITSHIAWRLKKYQELPSSRSALAADADSTMTRPSIDSSTITASSPT